MGYDSEYADTWGWLDAEEEGYFTDGEPNYVPYTKEEKRAYAIAHRPTAQQVFAHLAPKGEDDEDDE